MLQTFRERLQGWLITFIIALIVLGLGLFGLQNFWTGGGSDVIAQVDGDKIYTAQFNHTYEQARKRMMGSGLDVTDATQTLLKKEVLRSLITKHLELTSVYKAGAQVSLQQLQAAIFDMPYFQENGIFSYIKFQQFLATSGYTEAGFLSEIEKQAVVNQLKIGIVSSAFVMKNELEQLVALQKQTRSINYLLIPQSAITLKVDPQPEEIRAYYTQHQAAFKTPEKVKVDYVLLSPEIIKQRLSIKDSALQAYYEEHKAAYNQKPFKDVQEQIKQILLSEKLQSELPVLSEQLAELTYTHPDSLNAAAKALNLRVQTSDFFSKSGNSGIFSDPAVIRAAFNPDVLTQGRNSDLLRLKGGSVLVLRMKQYEPSKLMDLESVRPQIVNQLKAKMKSAEVSKLGAKWLGDLKAGKDIAPMLKQYKLTWKAAKMDTLKANDIDPGIWQLAFEIPAMAAPKHPLWAGKSLSNGAYALVQLNSVELGSLNQLSTEEKKALTRGLEQRYGQLDYHFYLEGVMNRAKIKISAD